MKLARTYRELLGRNPALGRLLAGEFISSVGDWLYLVAILIVVYAESNSPVLLGIVGAARILPYVFLSVPAGMVADRFDRRLVLLVTDVGRGAIMLLLAAAVLADLPSVVIVALAVVSTCFATFFGPAIGALIPTLVEESDLGPAYSAWATLDNVAFIVGPALAGILLANADLEFAFLLNAFSFAVVALVLWRLPVPGRAAQTSAPDEVPDTAVTRWRDLARPLAGPFILDATTSIVGGGIGVLTVVIAIDVLSAGEAGTGYLNAAIGVGGVVAGIAGGALFARRLGVPYLLGGAIGGIGLSWLGFAADLLTAVLAMAVAVGGLLLLDVVNTTVIQRIVPDAMRGRAMGVLQTSSAILYAGGSLVMPTLASVVGIGPVLVGAGVLTALGAGVALILIESAAEPSPIDIRLARLLEQPIFAGLPPARLEAVGRQLVEVPMAANEPVVRQGDKADRFYLIAEGTVAVTQDPEHGGETVHLRELGPGAVFGEIGLLRGTPRTATVTATTDGVLLALEADAFRDLVSSGPGFSTRLLDLYRGALTR